MFKKFISLSTAAIFLLIGSALVVTAEAPSISKEAAKSRGATPKQIQPLKPLKQIEGKNLTITNVSMDEVANGARFCITFTVSEKGSCKIVMVQPEVIIKAADGRTYHVQDRLLDDYNTLGYVRLSCDELRGGEGKYKYCGTFANAGPVWNQIGICLGINEPGLSATECTWYPLGTKPYYFLQQK